MFLRCKQAQNVPINFILTTKLKKTIKNNFSTSFLYTKVGWKIRLENLNTVIIKKDNNLQDNGDMNRTPDFHSQNKVMLYLDKTSKRRCILLL